MVAIKDMLGDGAVVRPDGRAADELRQVRITRHWTDAPEGSVLIECGNTRVMCTASFTPTLPRWRKDSGLGWVTAEYAMLPRATSERTARESVRGKVGGRTQEISRLIGRCLRGVVDMKALGENQVQLDCDVLQADGGTRTASVTGAYVALVDALRWAQDHHHIRSAEKVIKDRVSAVSVGIIDGHPMTSGFTNIAKAVFQTKPEQAPTVDAVSVPHTKRDESIGTTALPQGSQVKVSGTVSPAYLKNPSDSLSRDSTLTVTMVGKLSQYGRDDIL